MYQIQRVLRGTLRDYEAGSRNQGAKVNDCVFPGQLSSLEVRLGWGGITGLKVPV